MLVNQRDKNKPQIKGHYSPAHEQKILDVILDLINADWKDINEKELEKRLSIINKVFASLQLEGAHIAKELGLGISLFELALYLDDEYAVYIVTNYPEKIDKSKKDWMNFRENKLPREKDFIVITPAQAIYLIKSRENH